MPAPPVLAAVHAPTGAVIAAKVERADDYDSRARGLLGRDGLPAGEALLLSLPLWLVPCPSIHTFFMRFSIDVLFLDAERRVVRVIERMPPWRLSPWVWRARSVLELSAGTLAGRVKIGDRLELRAVEATR